MYYRYPHSLLHGLQILLSFAPYVLLPGNIDWIAENACRYVLVAQQTLSYRFYVCTMYMNPVVIVETSLHIASVSFLHWHYMRFGLVPVTGTRSLAIHVHMLTVPCPCAAVISQNTLPVMYMMGEGSAGRLLKCSVQGGIPTDLALCDGHENEIENGREKVYQYII